jgi:DNA-binding transcriptional ArsR family regulator
VIDMTPAASATALRFDQVFGALADATRRDIVRRAIDGEEGVAELAARYPMSFAAVQKHIAILERAGLVTKQRVGKRKVVRTDMDGLLIARRLLDQYEALWLGRVQRMADLLAEDLADPQAPATPITSTPSQPSHKEASR